jgi:hypothetical protein
MILNWNNFLIMEGKKDRDWFERNKDRLVTKKVEASDLYKYDLPEEIIDELRKWPMIMKSPLSDSFYSTDKTSYDYKPGDSYRASDHWNFISKKDDQIHCETNIPVKNNEEWCIGKYNSESKKYEIILRVPNTKYLEGEGMRKQLAEEEKVKSRERLRDPELIRIKREFKKRLLNHEIKCHLYYRGIEVSGILDRYTGPGGDIRIVDEEGNVVFTKNFGTFSEKDSRVTLKLFDENGDMDNPFIF